MAIRNALDSHRHSHIHPQPLRRAAAMHGDLYGPAAPEIQLQWKMRIFNEFGLRFREQREILSMLSFMVGDDFPTDSKTARKGFTDL